jgi:signal transduction histidine kinase
MLNNEKNLLNIIRFGAAISILIFSIFITYIIIERKNVTLKKEIDSFRNVYLNKKKTFIKNEVDRIISSINYEINNSEQTLKTFLKNRVYEAHQIATNIYNTKPTLSDDDNIYITKVIKNALEGMTYYDGSGYIFINNINGISILQARKEIEGQNLLEYEDPNGNKYIKKPIDIIKNKTEAYDEYYWYKSKEDKTAYRKISFHKYFEPLNFVIGTGEYFDDFEKKIQKDLLAKFKEIKFEESECIFIFNKKGEYLYHFDKNKTATNEEYFGKKILEFLKDNKEGYTEYLTLSKPNSKEKNIGKMSYIKYLDQWDWVIGSSFYMNELNDVIIGKEIELKENSEVDIHNILILSILLTIILLLISFYISKIISKKFIEYKKKIQKEINNTIEKERLLIQQSKMATIGEMIGNIAHQWKQPLSTISTISTGIKVQKELGCLEENDIVYGMSNINTAVQYLSQTIDDFRNFFKPDKTKMNFKVLDVFENTIKLINSQFRNNNIEIISNIDDNEINGYRNELLQVLINIFKNAKDEFIKLDKNKKRYIFIDAYKEDSNYIIKIKDNAGGINPDIIGDVFEAYFTTKEDHEGTGIGLYMCRQIINGMNGKIQVINTQFEYEGEEYQGAEFIIHIIL